MRNLSENIESRALAKGMEKGVWSERLNAVRRMLSANAPKEQILLHGLQKELCGRRSQAPDMLRQVYG